MSERPYNPFDPSAESPGEELLRALGEAAAEPVSPWLARMYGLGPGQPRPAPTVESLALRVDHLERELHELRQARLGARLRRGWWALCRWAWGD